MLFYYERQWTCTSRSRPLYSLPSVWLNLLHSSMGLYKGTYEIILSFFFAFFINHKLLVYICPNSKFWMGFILQNNYGREHEEFWSCPNIFLSSFHSVGSFDNFQFLVKFLQHKYSHFDMCAHNNCPDINFSQQLSQSDYRGNLFNIWGLQLI